MIKASLKSFLSGLRRKSIPSYRSGWGDNTPNSNSYISISDTALFTSSNSITKAKEETDKRIEAKPVDVYKEILTEEPKMNLVSLDNQIKMVERRIKTIENLDTNFKVQDERVALEFLKARKKYDKTKDLFGWHIATMEGIKKLTAKYKLQEVTFMHYYKTVPMEALDEIDNFVKAFGKVRDDNPQLHLIVDEGGKEQRKDPILLAGSPFGNWWYILGAWDKEVEIIDDLIYKGK